MKRLFALLLTFALAVSCAACGADNSGKAKNVLPVLDYKIKEKEYYEKRHDIDESNWFRLEIKVRGAAVEDIKFVNMQEQHEMNTRYR